MTNTYINIGEETEQIEFKKSTGELKEGVISIASILNKHGSGDLYFGVKNNGDVVGRITLDDDDPKVVLTKLGLAEGDLLLNAGAALFVDNGINELQMAKFASDERLTFNDIKRYTGSMFELADRAVGYVVDAMDWRVEFDGSLERKEILEIPVDVIREAVINAFGHRIIESEQSVEVAVYKSFIEIYSPGKFPDYVTPEQFVTESRKPIRRNPLITRTL